MNRRGVHRKQTATPGTHTHDTRDARHRASSSQGSHSATEERTCDRAAVARRRRPPGGRGRGARRGGAQAAAASGGRARPLLRGVRSACGRGAAHDSTRPGPRAAAPLQRPRGVSGRGAPRPLEDLLVPSAREAARRTAEEQTGRRGAERRRGAPRGRGTGGRRRRPPPQGDAEPGATRTALADRGARAGSPHSAPDPDSELGALAPPSSADPRGDAPPPGTPRCPAGSAGGSGFASILAAPLRSEGSRLFLPKGSGGPRVGG